MLAIHRNRLLYGGLTLGVLLMGLASRRLFGEIDFVKAYVGDALWALMVFFGLAFTLNRLSTKTILLLTLLFSFSIELSQLYHVPWIDNLRATRLGALVLGFSFVWSDLICYTIGALVGLLIELYIIPARYQRAMRISPGRQ
ncbi:ribosomal maturation YjgA family protein [Spirosoma koreense]